jgi:hypothetical protein
VPFAFDKQVVKALAPNCSHISLREGVVTRDREGRGDAATGRFGLPLLTAASR